MSEMLAQYDPTMRSRLSALVSYWRERIGRKLPRLVWYGDEIDVVVTFREARLPAGLIFSTDGTGFDEVVHASGLNDGALAKIESALNEIGITFDKGIGFGGRDWEWDYSLKGPISVRFRGRARKPEDRT